MSEIVSYSPALRELAESKRICWVSLTSRSLLLRCHEVTRIIADTANVVKQQVTIIILGRKEQRVSLPTQINTIMFINDEEIKAPSHKAGKS